MSDHNKKYSKIQEKRIAKSLGGRTQIASGALPIASKKGDVCVVDTRDWKLLIDGKTAKIRNHEEGQRSKKIEKDWINKVEQEASEGGYNFGMIAISFDNKTDYYLVKDIDFKNLYESVKDYECLVQGLRYEINQLKEELSRSKTESTIRDRYCNLNSLIEED